MKNRYAKLARIKNMANIEQTTKEKWKMTLKQYMRELWLMDRQYGQEEELYPLVNMLLREGVNTENLSIRDVHLGKTDNDGRKFIKGYVGFPDLVILGEEFENNEEYTNVNYLFGCVETKISKDVKSNGKQKLKELNQFLEGDGNRKITCKKEDNNYILLGEGSSDHYHITCNDKLWDLGQLLGEFLWYGKVLYTNGLVWKYIKVTECRCKENKINNIQELRKDFFENCNEIYTGKCEEIQNSEQYNQIPGLGKEVESLIKKEEFKNLKEDEQKKAIYKAIENVVKKILWLEFLVQKFKENDFTIEIEKETIGDLTNIYNEITSEEGRKANNSKNLFENLTEEDYRAWDDFKSKLAHINWQERVLDSNEQKE